MAEKLDLEAEYQNYLKQVGLSEETMVEDQARETKIAFLGGMSSMYLVMQRVLVQSAEEIIADLTALQTELEKYWNSHNNNHADLIKDTNNSCPRCGKDITSDEEGYWCTSTNCYWTKEK